MTTSVPPARKPGIFTQRFAAKRLALLAGVAGLPAPILFAGPSLAPKAGFPSITAAYAQPQRVQRPVGFADIVEKVKPAVISVRVKMNAGPRVMSFNNRENSPL